MLRSFESPHLDRVVWSMSTHDRAPLLAAIEMRLQAPSS
jgi:hypothetical protein